MLKPLYEQLVADTSSHEYRAVPIPELTDSYLAVDSLGRPALFIKASETAPIGPLRTAQVSLRSGARFTLTAHTDSPITGAFDCLACESSDQSAIDTFLVLVQAFVSSQNPEPGERLADFFRSIVRLFAVPPARDLRAERQGLWGELFLMRAIKGFSFWAPYWHTEPTRRFDFSTDGKRVEVKSVLEGPRIHHFAHRQVYALSGEEIVIASLLVAHDDAGLTLRDLVNECREALAGTPHFMSLERAVRRAGFDDPDDPGPSFDPTAALTNLAWFNSQQVPHFRMLEPPGVSDTGYRVDLSTAPRLTSDELSTWLEKWEAAEITAT